jgi:hypothetical protein
MATHKQKKDLVHCLDTMLEVFARNIPAGRQQEIETFLVAKDRAHWLIAGLGNGTSPAKEEETHDEEDRV